MHYGDVYVKARCCNAQGYAPGGAERATTRSQNSGAAAAPARPHLSGAAKDGGGHQRGAQPPAPCTGTNADTCAPCTGSDASDGFRSSSSSSRYGLNSLKGLRGCGGSAPLDGAYDSTDTAAGAARRRIDRSMGSVVGGITGIGAGSGVGKATGVGRLAGGGDGRRALSGEPAE